MSTAQILQVFRESEDLDEIKAAVEQAQDRLYTSWASVQARDNAKELIPIEEVIAQQDILLNRAGPISDMHTNKIVGRTLAYKVLEHPTTKTLGVLHLNKIYNDNPVDHQVWKEIQNGERTGSSVGGLNTGDAFEMYDGKMTKVLTGFHQYETASVDNPCNPFATNTAVSAVAKANTETPGKSITEQFKVGFDVERKEHSQFSDSEVGQVVIDHLREDPEYYMKDTKKIAPEPDVVGEIDKALVPLGSKQPPKGAKIVTGPKGGKYIDTGSGSKPAAEDNKPGKAPAAQEQKPNSKPKLDSDQRHNAAEATLLNDENSSDDEMRQYFKEELGMSDSEANHYVGQRDQALREHLNFAAEPYEGSKNEASQDAYQDDGKDKLRAAFQGHPKKELANAMRNVMQELISQGSSKEEALSSVLDGIRPELRSSYEGELNKPTSTSGSLAGTSFEEHPQYKDMMQEREQRDGLQDAYNGMTKALYKTTSPEIKAKLNSLIDEIGKEIDASAERHDALYAKIRDDIEPSGYTRTSKAKKKPEIGADSASERADADDENLEAYRNAKSNTSSSQSPKSDSVIKTAPQEQQLGEPTMSTKIMKQADILNVAKAKLAKGEPLAEDERSALLTAVDNKAPAAEAKDEAEETEKSSTPLVEEAAGKTGKDIPKPVEGEAANDVAVFKAELAKRDAKIAEIEKRFEASTKTVTTPRVGASVAKVGDVADLAMNIATGQNRKVSWNEVHKMAAKFE